MEAMNDGAIEKIFGPLLTLDIFLIFFLKTILNKKLK